MPLVVSLYDYSGTWSQPYLNAGYDVVRVDIQHGSDIYDLDADSYKPHGVLAAPPCTEFAGSGAQWWPQKDEDGRTDEAVKLIRHTLHLIDSWKPAWWALENPVGRLSRLVPEIGPWVYSFHPCDFGEPYTKRSLLWGDFNSNLARTPVEPTGHRPGQPNEWYSRVGGKSQATKNHRSQTPVGFARAFFEANP